MQFWILVPVALSLNFTRLLTISVAGNRPAPVFPFEVGCVDSISFSKKRASRFLNASCTCRHGGRFRKEQEG